uniref:Uncharacterized protein n=1 Tax=Melopsittacus undulatus TaxID=13146 RepID=A0A8C6NBW6_MELUD
MGLEVPCLQPGGGRGQSDLLDCVDQTACHCWECHNALLAEGNVEFGTAGPRATMGTGISHMNDSTIIQYHMDCGEEN